MKQFSFYLSTLLGTKTKLLFIWDAEPWQYWNGININKTTYDNSTHVTISSIVGCEETLQESFGGKLWLNNNKNH